MQQWHLECEGRKLVAHLCTDKNAYNKWALGLCNSAEDQTLLTELFGIAWNLFGKIKLKSNPARYSKMQLSLCKHQGRASNLLAIERKSISKSK
jgi:hypothetical protein